MFYFYDLQPRICNVSEGQFGQLEFNARVVRRAQVVDGVVAGGLVQLEGRGRVVRPLPAQVPGQVHRHRLLDRSSSHECVGHLPTH